MMAEQSTTSTEMEKPQEEGKLFIGTYYDGKGKYQFDYNRLAVLIPKNGSTAKTLAGEILRTISKLSYKFYINGELNDILDALAFLAMAGIFNGSDGLSALYTNASDSSMIVDEDQVETAIERMIDNAINLILMHPDLEYAENTIDMSTVNAEKQMELIEHTIAANNLAAAFTAAGTPTKQPLQEISIGTPRTSNHRNNDVKKEAKIGYV